MKRIIYLFYYLKITDWNKLHSFTRYVRVTTENSSFRLISDMIYSAIRYKISFLDYFYLHFYERKHEERLSYAGTGFMYEYQLQMNPKKHRVILEDKKAFLKAYSGFVKRSYLSLEDLQSDSEKLQALMNNPSNKVVIKHSRGQVGSEVEVLDCSKYSPESLTAHMKQKKYDLLEEYVVQHPDLMKLSPAGLNTIRIITQITDDGKVVILAARLRVSINSQVDNMGAGNIAASVDVASGRVNGPGVFSDITREDLEEHPVTGVALRGFQIPHWKSILDISQRAALLHPENRSIGWDVGLTADGPELIEGNHNWCKLLWQLPVKKGLKAEITSYLN